MIIYAGEDGSYTSANINQPAFRELAEWMQV